MGRRLGRSTAGAERFTEGVLNQPCVRESALPTGRGSSSSGRALDEAEEAYREASRLGSKTQPGLALLRLAQGNSDAAAAAIRRAASEATDADFQRAALLPAYIAIMLAIGEVARPAAPAESSSRSRNVKGVKLWLRCPRRRGGRSLWPRAMPTRPWSRCAARSRRGSSSSRRTRSHLSACRWASPAGRWETKTRLRGELEAARAVFAQLGGTPDVIRVDSLAPLGQHDSSFGLTARELQVLRLVAAGKSNRAIAADLVISDHTAARISRTSFASSASRREPRLPHSGSGMT